MQEFQIGTLKKLCFVVKKGTAKNIVVPYDNLADIDKKRFFEMEKQGGELMRVMRDTMLDNGVNALVMYADMLVEIDVVVPKKVAAEKSVDDTTATDKPVRKSRGRPPGKKNKTK